MKKKKKEKKIKWKKKEKEKLKKMGVFFTGFKWLSFPSLYILMRIKMIDIISNILDLFH